MRTPRRSPPICNRFRDDPVRKIVHGLKQVMTEEKRYAVADRAADQLKQYDDPWRLDEEIPLIKQHRHAVVNVGNKPVRVGDYHGARLERFAARLVPSLIPQAGDRQCRRAIPCREIPRLLTARRVLPFVIARHRNEAARALECPAEEPFFRDRLRSCVES